jgi:hypothetical protein
MGRGGWGRWCGWLGAGRRVEPEDERELLERERTGLQRRMRLLDALLNRESSGSKSGQE